MNRVPAVAVGVVVLLLAAPLPSVVAAQDDPTPTANETSVRHVNPDSARGDGDLSRLESYLSRELGGRLSNGAIKISQGQYDQAKHLLGDDYRDALGKYVDVADETGDEETAETFRETRERQRDFANSTQSYAETLRDYREAKRNGNQTRARRLARALDAQADNVTADGRALRGSYDALGNTTGLDVSRGETAINETVANVTAQQAQVRSEEFVTTNLTVRADSQRVSFANPLRLGGHLRLANGTAVSEQRITLRIHNRTVTTRTDGDGEFMVAYRPVTLPVTARNVSVSYVPNETSVLFRSNASVPVQVSQVDSTVTVQNATSSAAYGDTVAATARVTAAGRPVPGLPVAVSVGGQQLATGRTTENGTVALAGALPAGVRTGDQPLRVSVAATNRAVAASNATGSLTVEESATDLTAAASVDGTTVTVRGQLTTAAGRAIAGQAVEVRRNGTMVATGQTGPNGSYRATFEGEPGRRYSLATSYDDPSTNLGPSTARTSVTVPRMHDARDPSVRGDSWSNIFAEVRDAILANRLLVGVGLLATLLAGVVLWLSRRGTGDAAAAPVESAITEVNPAGDGPDDGDEDVLASARNALDADPTAAVERAYRDVRTQLQARGIAASSDTHWEFYDACRSAGVDDTVALEAFTATFEQAAFGRQAISREEAATALERGTEVVENVTGAPTD